MITFNPLMIVIIIHSGTNHSDSIIFNQEPLILEGDAPPYKNKNLQSGRTVLFMLVPHHLNLLVNTIDLITQSPLSVSMKKSRWWCALMGKCAPLRNYTLEVT